VLTIGVVGCGDVATRAYLPGIKHLEDKARLVACFDTIAERAETAAAMFPGAIAYTSYDAFLAHPGGMDLVINLTPAPLHRQITGQALEAGYNVFSEKPIAATIEQANELVALAGQAGKQLFCAPAVMVTARFRWLKEYVQSGAIGRPTLNVAQIGSMGPAAWRTYTGDPTVVYKPGVGPLIDTGVYMLTAMTGMLGPAKRVAAMGGIAIPERNILIPAFEGKTAKVETEDIMMIHLDFGENTFGQLLSSFAIPQSHAPMFELFGEGGTISIRRDQWYNGNGTTDLYLRNEADETQEGWRENVPVPAPIATDGILESGILHVLECLEGEATPVMTAAHATHVLEIMNAARESVRSGKAIALTTTFGQNARDVAGQDLAAIES
jgi:predicted dehydrogenase